MTNVIIHIYPGRGKEEEREFYNKKEQGINIFKEYLLEVLGHVGISFPPEKKIYGFGPIITEEDIIPLRNNYSERVNSMRMRIKHPWNAVNFLFYEDSPVFQGKVFTDDDDNIFFASHPHIEIPLKLKGMSKKDALNILTKLDAPYGSKFQGQERENCLTAIFNHLPLYYRNDKPVVLSEPGMLRNTLVELQKGIEGESGAASKQGGKRRRKRKTKRKKRKKRRTKRKKKRKRKKRSRRRKRKSRRKKGGKKLDDINCWSVEDVWTPCRTGTPGVFGIIQTYRRILDINSIDDMWENKEFMYAMECAEGGLTGDGNIWIFPDEKIPGINKSGNHPCLIDDKPAQAAGIIIKNKNKITIDACSGHYFPSAQISLGNVIQYLKNKGIIDLNETPEINEKSVECDDHSPMITFILNKEIFNRDGKRKSQPALVSEEEKIPEAMVPATKPSFEVLDDEGKVAVSDAAPAPANLTVQTQGEERGPSIMRVKTDDSVGSDMSID